MAVELHSKDSVQISAILNQMGFQVDPTAVVLLQRAMDAHKEHGGSITVDQILEVKFQWEKGRATPPQQPKPSIVQ